MSSSPVVSRAKDQQIIPTSWGKLIWQASGFLKNSHGLTTGLCVINKGLRNERHYHPNCEEVLTVLKGRIIHTWNDQEVEMTVGEVIIIPPHVIHNAINIGVDACELAISFSSAYRESVLAEETK